MLGFLELEVFRQRLPGGLGAALEVLSEVLEQLRLADAADVEGGLELDDLVRIREPPPTEGELCNNKGSDYSTAQR